MDKLLKALAANPVSTLQELLLAEKAGGKHKDSKSACCALLWFKRCAPWSAPCMPPQAECSRSTSVDDTDEETLDTDGGH